MSTSREIYALEMNLPMKKIIVKVIENLGSSKTYDVKARITSSTVNASLDATGYLKLDEAIKYAQKIGEWNE